MERLAEGVHRPLVLVNGPAGAGKTLLVADWLAQDPLPWTVAWLTAESDDDAPGLFWADVQQALRHHGLPLPHDVGTPARAEEVDRSLLVRFAAHLNGLTDPVLLVLDEFDRVTSPVIADQLEFVLHHAGPALRLVVISRTEPLLPLHRHRAADEMTDVRGADLAFTEEETAALLARHGLERGAETARLLTGRTEGWAAGVRLCALAMRQADDPDRFLKEFEAGHSTIADFLLGEVLDMQPFETQDLLLRTSILEQVHPDLANALTGRDDGEGILASLERSNAFVTAAGHGWYRHHPLFAEILRVHLRSRYPGLERQLHRTAARRLCDAGQLLSALRHAAAAEDWEFAATQFVSRLGIGRLFTGLDADGLGELFSAMAPGTPGAAAELVRAACALARYDATGGLAHLSEAEARLAAASADPAEAAQAAHPAALSAMHLSCAFLRVVAGRLLGSADMAEAAAAAAERPARQVPSVYLAQHPELPALLLTDLGSARLSAGHLDAAEAALAAAVEASASDTPGTAFSCHEALGGLALIDFLRGWPGKAEVRAREAVAEALRAGLSPARSNGIAHLVLAAVAVEHDDLAVARAELERASASCGALDDPVVAAGAAVLGSRLLPAAGDPQASPHALTGAGAGAGARPGPGGPPPWAHFHLAPAEASAHLARGAAEAAREALEGLGQAPDCVAERAVAVARAWIAGGESRKAIEVLDSLPTGAGTGPAITVRALLARAEAADRLGDAAAARRLVMRALGLARPDHLRRPFLDAGPWLRRALHGRRLPAHDWLPPERVGARPAEPAGTAQAFVVEPLSPREHEVLECAAQLMSTEEIAAHLCLSVNTVKTHLKSIYRKLSASRRGEAVRRARELQLL
ncbi:LuxR C-terminal-related transcriptional regulator [Streptomyces sp. NPDC050448]|uniref:LuxR C-terminal-related transcriptional regulator n=1 Tax=Streptomyces sp. NPDC050448 TaxID=3155404 RepID=UPI003443E368